MGEQVEALHKDGLELKKRVDSLEGSLREELERKVTEEVMPVAEDLVAIQEKLEAFTGVQESLELLDERAADLKQRIEALEGISRRTLRRTVQDYLGKDFSPGAEASASNGPE